MSSLSLSRYEACRIRLVSQPDYASSLVAVGNRMMSEMGFVGAFYSGATPPLLLLFASRLSPISPLASRLLHVVHCPRQPSLLALLVGTPPLVRRHPLPSSPLPPPPSPLPPWAGFVPILFKQIPYTMAKFVVQGKAQESIATSIGGMPKSESGKIGVSLASGVVAGVVAAIISHPADTLLSKMNKGGAGGTGGMMSRMGNIVAETGVVTLCTQGLSEWPWPARVRGHTRAYAFHA